MGVEPTSDAEAPHIGFEVRARHRPGMASMAIVAMLRQGTSFSEEQSAARPRRTYAVERRSSNSACTSEFKASLNETPFSTIVARISPSRPGLKLWSTLEASGNAYPASIPRSSNGRTAAFGAVNRGSNPCRGATHFVSIICKEFSGSLYRFCADLRCA